MRKVLQNKTGIYLYILTDLNRKFKMFYFNIKWAILYFKYRLIK